MPPSPVKELSRSDIEQRCLTNVFRDDWKTVNGVLICRCFIQIETGIVFELAYDDFAHHSSLQSVSVDAGELWKVDWAYGPNGCCGEVIKNVVYSDCWPSIGLLFESGRILYCADYGTPYQVGPLLGRINDIYNSNEIINFWNHIPLA